MKLLCYFSLWCKHENKTNQIKNVWYYFVLKYLLRLEKLYMYSILNPEIKYEQQKVGKVGEEKRRDVPLASEYHVEISLLPFIFVIRITYLTEEKN